MSAQKIGLFLFLLFASILKMNGQENESLKGYWKGKIVDSTSVFEYILHIESIKRDAFFGVAYSNGEDFYCETRISGSIKADKINFLEEKIVFTNYPNKKELCLQSFFLTKEKNQLVGKYIPRNNFSVCRKGNIKLQKETNLEIPGRKEQNKVKA